MDLSCVWKVGYQQIPGINDTRGHQAALAPAVAEVTIEIWLPNGRSINIGALETNDIREIKSKIEAAEPCYPTHHQRLFQPGYLEDLVDDRPVFSFIRSGFHFVLREKSLDDHLTVKL